MYNVQVDEKLFYTGTYAKVGTVNNGVNVEKLPPSENSLCYKLVDVEVPNSYEEPVLQYIMESIDENGELITIELSKDEYDALEDKSAVVVSYKEDEDGNVVYETIKTTEIVKDWEFSQERFDELEAAKKAKEEQQKAEAEYQASISNETLANRIGELESSSVTLETMSEAILKGVNEV